jgi:DNA-binding transcriptional LysR family regulator
MARSPLAHVDANLLVALEALLAEENVGRAARRMGVSASAMSHTLARLRELVGDPLLVRAGQRMTLTDRARGLVGPLRDGVGSFATVLARPVALDLRREQRTVRVASVDFAQSMLVPRLANVLASEAPGIDLVVKPFADRSLEELTAGEVDLVLCLQRTSTGLRSRTIHEEPFVCCVRRGHPLLRERLGVRRFAALDHVLISPRGRVRGAVDDALRGHGLRRRVAVVVTTFMAAALLVAASDLVLTCAATSALEAERHFGLQSFRPPLAIAPARMGMFWHARQHDDPCLAWFRDRVAEVPATARA